MSAFGTEIGYQDLLNTTTGTFDTTTVGTLMLPGIPNSMLKTVSGTVTAAVGNTDYQNVISAGTGISLVSDVVSNTGVLSILGTANQINASASTGAVTLSLPQSIAVSSSPSFAGLTVSSYSGMLKGTAGVIGIATVGTDYEGPIAAGTTAQYWRGDKTWQTLNQAAVAGLTTASSPTFAGLTSTGSLAVTGTATFAVPTNINSSVTQTYYQTSQSGVRQMYVGSYGNYTTAGGIIASEQGDMVVNAYTGKQLKLQVGYTTVGSLNSAGMSVTGTLGVSGTTTLSSGLTGLLKATSGVVSQAVAGTDYYTPGSVIPISGGGTGLTSYLAGQIMAFSGSTTISMINPVATGSLLISQGSSSVPVFSNQPTLSGNANLLQVSGSDTADNSNLKHISFNGVLQAAAGGSPRYVSNTGTVKTNGGVSSSTGYIEYLNGTFSATSGICFYTNTAQLYVDAGAKTVAIGSSGGNASTNAYGVYAKMPASGIGDNRLAMYADNLHVGLSADSTNTVGTFKVAGSTTLGGILNVVGATGISNTLNVTGVTTLSNTLNTQNVSTTGTVTASGVITGSNLNLSGFTFNSSLACAAATYSSTWSGMTGTPPTCNFTLTRFGHIVTLRISTFIYPSTESCNPYCELNPSGWAPPTEAVIPIMASHYTNFTQCSLLVNPNCTFYLYGPVYPNVIRTTATGYCFPYDCVVSWSMY